MRFLYPLFFIICFISCKAKSELIPVNNVNPVISDCPENGHCTLDVYKHKALQTKVDDFGQIYTETVKGNHYVLKFEYKKHTKTNYQDSSYREEVYIELDKNNLEIETTNLQAEKLYFARWCYCKGQTGFYKIKQGKFKVSRINATDFQLNLHFKIDEVPQIISEINRVFKIQ